MQAASSVAAHGAFARAGEDEITIAFDYRFVDAGDTGDAELLVFLSGSPDVSTSLSAVLARVWPPASGPGSVGRGAWAHFSGEFARGDLNFTRGTYVELELRGAGAQVQIDNFDPAVICTSTCGDLDGSGTLDDLDLLVALAGFGQGVFDETGRACLDSYLSQDRYTTVEDALAWDLARGSTPLNRCGDGLETSFMPPPLPAEPNTVTLPAGTQLLLAGKPGAPGLYEDYLYPLDDALQCIGSTPLRPASTPDPNDAIGHIGNGRLVQDGGGHVYQLHGWQGADPVGHDHGGGVPQHVHAPKW